jgi:dihydroorotate dehydrogenase
VTHEIGGLSGKPLFDHSTWMLAETFLRVEKQFPLIGVGGVSSAETAIAKIEAGATLIQLYSALTYTGINLVNEIKRGLSEYLWINSQPSHEILIGRTAHKWQGRFAK